MYCAGAGGNTCGQKSRGDGTQYVNLEWPNLANYCRLGFEYVVKQLRMVLYKPGCDSNDCELPNKKVTPSILAIEVWLMRLHVGWAINIAPYYLSDSCTWLGIGRLTVGLKNRRLILNMREIENA